MNGTQWIIFLLIIQVIHFLGTWKLYVKAGRKAWEAAIPVYNAIVLMQIINRPKWWVILLFIPIINLLMIPVVWVETIRSFGRNSLMDTWAVILTLGLYIYYVNYALDVTYIEDRDLKPRTGVGEWVSSIVFAVVAASLVHAYFIQPFVIPTGSLEKTLLIGDFLFVSKFHYGARTPMTTVAAPMVHDTLPILGTRSYLADVNPETYKSSWKNKLQLPYFRLPGFEKVKHNDIVVFSWPADTVFQFHQKREGVRKPIDKKSNYVKRCVGLPGDSLSVKNGDVYVNGSKLILSDRAKPQFMHLVSTTTPITNWLRGLGQENYMAQVISMPAHILEKENVPELMERLSLQEVTRDSSKIYLVGGGGMNQKSASYLEIQSEPNMGLFNMTEEEAEKWRGENGVKLVSRFSLTAPESNIFPQNKRLPGNQDNFGPIYIPAKGATINLDIASLPYYKKIIQEYENNSLSVSGNQITINGEVTNTYTFKQDYYWMMGDNRHRSEDSRFWGYVPENHIVGKPVFIWMSIDGINDGMSNWSIRWDRVFTTVGGDGEPRSYFKYFLILLAAYFVFDFFRKKKRKKAA
jgi:signal peptidase I